MASTSRLALTSLCCALVGCSSLLGLDELSRVDCMDDCGEGAHSGVANGGTTGDAASAGADSPGAGTGSKGGSAGRGGDASAAGTENMPAAGTTGSEGGTPGGGSGGSAGSGGVGPTGACPGGPAPSATWKEHWSGHTDSLTLRGYDDCVALYVDGGMTGVDTAWLASFLKEAWTYNLATYGAQLGSERLYVVLHKNKFLGGHAAVHYETSHDSHNVIDAGDSTWTDGGYDLPARLLSSVVERTAVKDKQGSPGAAQWSSEGFAQIYTYDLYSGLGMKSDADRVFDEFEPTHFTYPVPNSYWFADFYYPTWRDHGKSKTLVDFFDLLQRYYPANNQVMPPMNWGEYIHFASGAASADLQDQATYAFGWSDDWQGELAQARLDFSAIEY